MLKKLIFILFVLSLKLQVLAGGILRYDHFQNVGIDSIITELKHEKETSNKDVVYISRLLANAYVRKGVYKLAEDELIETIGLMTNEVSEESRGLVYLELGDVYKFAGEYDEAIKFYLKGIDVFKHKNLWNLYCEAHISVAEYYRKIGGKVRGLEYINEALNIYIVQRNWMMNKYIFAP
jgi:tetratricopeptide (TPR) repeat protein